MNNASTAVSDHTKTDSEQTSVQNEATVQNQAKKGRPWIARLQPYTRSDDNRSIFEFIVTVIPLIALWVISYQLLIRGLWFVLPVTLLPAGLFMVRLFILQHDCGHGSLFSSRNANKWLGRILGVFTMTPYEYWRRLHAAHHACSGNLDRRGVGDIDTLTIDEYRAKSTIGRLVYRLYRHPLIMFGLGPAYLFIFRHRLPIGAMTQGHISWVSAIATNICIAVVFALIMQVTGVVNFLIIHTPIIVIAASVGVWMFYVQHQFEETHWSHNPEWNHGEAALHGSSYYDLPAPLMWLTGYIGIHHVHHLSSRIPFHKLPKVMQDFPELESIGRITLWESLKTARLALWDDAVKELISFAEYHKRNRAVTSN